MPLPTSSADLDAEDAARENGQHVHVFDRTATDPGYLGIGAILPACACGVVRP